MHKDVVKLLGVLKRKNPKLYHALEEKIKQRMTQKRSGNGIMDNVSVNTSDSIKIEILDMNGNVVNTYTKED